MFQVSITVLIVYICLVYNFCAGVRKYIPSDGVCIMVLEGNKVQTMQ